MSSKQQKREFKIENGEIIRLSEEELESAVNVFQILRKCDNHLLLEALNGSKIKLRRLMDEEIKIYVGVPIFIAIHVKEEIQMKHWDFYYKLEKVTLDSYSVKTKLCSIKTHRQDKIEIEARNIFVEVTS